MLAADALHDERPREDQRKAAGRKRWRGGVQQEKQHLQLRIRHHQKDPRWWHPRSGKGLRRKNKALLFSKVTAELWAKEPKLYLGGQVERGTKRRAELKSYRSTDDR